MELLRKPPEGVVIPSTATVNRILVHPVELDRATHPTLDARPALQL
jgi:hypothetical protein